MKIALRAFLVTIVLALIGLHWQLNPSSALLEPVDRASKAVSVEPLPLMVYCPGALVEVGGVSGVELGKVERVGEALVSASYESGSLSELPPVSSTEGFSAIAEQGEQSTNLISSLQAQAIDRERSSGLAATYCAKPTASGWLLNGSAVVGSESVLIAANPSAVEALVEIDFHFQGRIVSERIALAPQERKLIPTAAYANGERQFAIFFQSSGPAISMVLQNRETRGLQPTGVELEPVTSNPAKMHYFVGFRPLTQGFENARLRIYNPGIDSSEVVVTAFGLENVELFRTQVGPGSFSDIELVVGEGHQLIALEASAEVIAAIKNPTIDPILDFAWIQPAELFSSVTVPLSTYRNNLVIANPEATALEITLEVDFGSRTSLETAVVAPYSQLVLPLSGVSVKVDGSSLFGVALEILDPAGYSVVSPTESANPGRDLEIFVD